ncbi:hypothetical protein PS15p_210251 [Mucor circinelloides]
MHLVKTVQSDPDIKNLYDPDFYSADTKGHKDRMIDTYNTLAEIKRNILFIGGLQTAA